MVGFILCSKGQRQRPPLGLAVPSPRQGGLPITAQGLRRFFLCLGRGEMTGAIGQCMHFGGHTFVLGPWVGRWQSDVFSLVPDSLSNPPKNHGLPSYQGWLFYFFIVL